MPTWPLPSPPLNQIWLPPPPEPLRKLQAVRFSTVTPSALKTSTPLRPSPFGPKSWSPAADEHFGEPGLVPSTTTPVAVEAAQVDVGRRDEDAGAGLVGRLVGRVVAALVVIAGRDRIQSPGRAASTAAWIELNCAAAVPGGWLWATRRTRADATAVKASETPRASTNTGRPRVLRSFLARVSVPVWFMRLPCQPESVPHEGRARKTSRRASAEERLSRVGDSNQMRFGRSCASARRGLRTRTRPTRRGR